MLSTNLADLYGVEPRALMQAVRRNANRFPADFMFQLTSEEYQNLKSQFVTSSSHGGLRKLPYAFTDYGVAMLSSVLNSDRAVEVHIQIMRAFCPRPGNAGIQRRAYPQAGKSRAQIRFPVQSGVRRDQAVDDTSDRPT
jgi:hypothetical protein